MTRYTKAQFESDIDELNRKLKAAGVDRIYITGYRYGYTAVDWATERNAAKHCINGTVCAGGTPKQMIDKTREDFINHI